MLDLLRTGGMKPFTSMMERRKAKALSERAAAIIPLRKADLLSLARSVSWWQDWMDHAEPGDPWWNPINYGAATQTMPPSVMTAGWYDIFLPFQLRDFVAAQDAGRDVRITIGPWTHVAFAGLAESLRQSITLFQGTPGAQPRVRLFLMGAEEWRGYSSWPPPNTSPRPLYLHPSGRLSADAPISEGESVFDYDPAHPTPAFHGATPRGAQGLGATWQNWKRRSDVWSLRPNRWASDLDAIGPVSAEIFLRSNTEHTDLYVCLCGTSRRGARSTNVCDGYRRLRPDGSSAGDARRSA